MTKRNKRDWSGHMSDEDYREYYFSNPPRQPLRRNKIDGMVGGVCAGIADFYGWDILLVRVLFLILTIVFSGAPLLIYIFLWIFTPADKRAPYHREYKEARKARRENSQNPPRTASYRDVKSKFRSLETRMQDLERSVTSKEWKLRRDFRDLDK